MSIKIKVDKNKFSSSRQKFTYKFLVLGEQMIGKTSVLERYVNNQFKINYLTTVGMDKRIKRLELGNCDIDLYITDTAGQERYRSITKMFYKGADGILVGFSLLEESTLESVHYWLKQIKENLDDGKNISIILFGNKCDCKESIKITKAKIDEMTNKYNLKYFETSAKENINVKEMFEYLTKMCLIRKKDINKIIGFKDKYYDEKNFNEKEIPLVEKENQKPDKIKIEKKKKKKNCC